MKSRFELNMTDEQQDNLGNTEETLTNRQGHPIYDNQNTRTVGDRGPTVLENYNFLEKITHFDRERIPERVVHARGAGAHGYFEAYGTIGDEPASKYTRANFSSKKAKLPLYLSVFLALFTAVILLRRCAIRVDLQLNSIPKMATGI